MPNQLSDKHQHMLFVESGIAPEVAEARGYRTVTDEADLRALDFHGVQLRVPALLIPVHPPDGGNSLYRLRPDSPRVREDKERKNRDGTYHNDVIKYEQPAGKGLRWDCNPFAREWLANPSRPLLIVEGEKKADCAISRGLCSIALPGVTGYKARNEMNGVTLSADLDYIAVKGRAVYIGFDSDVITNPDVARAETMLAEHLKRKGGDVHLLRLPIGEGGRKQGVDDYLVAGHSITDLLATAIDHAPLLSRSYQHVKASGLPGIQTNNRHLRDVAEDALKALSDANSGDAHFFVRGGLLARVRMTEEDVPVIEDANEAVLRGRMARVANFIAEREHQGTRAFTPQSPPLDVVRDILALGAWPFPPLRGIIECPSLRPDGTVITRPGYDASTALLYVPDAEMQVPPIPEQPSETDVALAKNLLHEALGEFPFDNPACYANALALLLTPLVRPAIAGTVPLALIDAPQAGTGKSLLAQIVGMVATGHTPSIITAPRDGDEWRKKITSSLGTGATVITIDNLSGPLYAGELSAVLTTSVWEDRKLGSNVMLHYPNRATWLATGNNVQLGGDLPRRCYHIRLDAKTSRPFKREGFKHVPLLTWVQHQRGALIAAGLTLARAWYAAGSPPSPVKPIGSFESWCHILAGILNFAGVSDFLANLEEMYLNADQDTPQWEAFLTALAEHFGDQAITTSQICELIADKDREIGEMVPEYLMPATDDKGGIKPAFRSRLGKELSKRVGVRFGDDEVRIKKGAPDRKRAVMWSFETNVQKVSAESGGNHLGNPRHPRQDSSASAEGAEDAEGLSPEVEMTFGDGILLGGEL